ncbi:MAG TPA: cation:dicarboxylase symporter family transporter, partial [Candidatus Hydrogenedentes bacterium]|nr:cation:dicarboxylase symporter family transporter [Candidatus Hydrogenedentota bacterium]
MRRHLFFYLFLGLVAAFLGAASAWPLDSGAALLRAGARVVLLWAVEVAFLVVLPRRLALPWQIFVAMVGGVLGGWAVTRWDDPAFISDYLGVFGVLFILLLTVVIIPLIFVSVLCGVAGIGDVRKLGRLGAKTIVYFLSTTSI